ncbi:MAG: hypothetical protein ACOH2V_08865 [Candidatus Saccharimonadaceae bacterium]
MKALSEGNMPLIQLQTLNFDKEVFGKYLFNSIPFLVLIDNEGEIMKKI